MGISAVDKQLLRREGFSDEIEHVEFQGGRLRKLREHFDSIRVLAHLENADLFIADNPEPKIVSTLEYQVVVSKKLLNMLDDKELLALIGSKLQETINTHMDHKVMGAVAAGVAAGAVGGGATYVGIKEGNKTHEETRPIDAPPERPLDRRQMMNVAMAALGTGAAAAGVTLIATTGNSVMPKGFGKSVYRWPGPVQINKEALASATAKIEAWYRSPPVEKAAGQAR